MLLNDTFSKHVGMTLAEKLAVCWICCTAAGQRRDGARDVIPSTPSALSLTEIEAHEGTDRSCDTFRNNHFDLKRTKVMGGG